jgi:integrase
LGQALKWDLVVRHIATLTEPPHSVRTPVEPLNATQVAQLLAATKDDRLGPLIHVAIATGLRQGELLGLRWEDVDLAQGTLRVRHAMQRIDGVPTFIEPKTQRSRRVVALPPSAVAALTVQHDRQVFVRQAAGAAWQEWHLVFASAVGTPLNPSNVTHHLQAVLAEAGLPRQRFHDLRHCCASLLLTQNVPARVVMEQLGHSQIALTMNTYSHVMPAMQREAADRMEEVLAATS